MSKIADINNDNNDTLKDNMIVAEGCYSNIDDDTTDGCPEEAVDKLCLNEGRYEFTIRDNVGDGIDDPGYYAIASNGDEIKRGGGDNGFKDEETTVFTMPLVEKPSTQPTSSELPTNSLLPSSSPSSEFACEVVSTKKQCIKQSESCMWDNVKDICIDAATSFPTFSPSTMPTSTSTYPRTSPPITTFPTYQPTPNTPQLNQNALVKAVDDTITLQSGTTEQSLIAVLENDTGSNLIVSAITNQPTNGQCFISLNLSEVVYIPNDTSFVGSDQCTYETCDDEEDCDTAIVRINIDSGNSPTPETGGFNCPPVSLAMV